MQITDILDNVSKVIVGKEEVTKKVIVKPIFARLTLFFAATIIVLVPSA